MKRTVLKILQDIPFVRKEVLRAELKKQHSAEIALLKNINIDASDRQSIIHFSTYKSATQYVKGILNIIVLENGLIPVDLNGYGFVSKSPVFDRLTFEEMERYKHVFKTEGFLYSVFRSLVKNIDNLNKYHIILSIRDPRDMLVSKYYSLVYSHPVPPVTSNKRRRFLKARERAKRKGIDEFVLSGSNHVVSIFADYKKNLIDKFDNVTMVRYEKMVTDFESWLDDLISGSGLKISTQLREELIMNNELSKVKKENKYAYLRKGVAGDYKEKLQPATIEKLNAVFSEILMDFDYSVKN